MASNDWIFSQQVETMMGAICSWEAEGKTSTQIVKQLRKTFSPEETSRLLDLHELRIRAQKKFTRAREMYFTRTQLEQASSEIIAEYKSKRFANKATIVDLCCGIGGDSIALAQSTDLTIVDTDELVLEMAARNIQAYNRRSNQVFDQAESIDVARFDAFHIDPDRRARNGSQKTAKRTVQADNFSPSESQLKKLEKANPHFGLKLAPASEIWQGNYEIEFVGHLRECKQQMVWSGDLIAAPGITATVISNQGEKFESFHVDKTQYSDPEFATTVKKYIYDPHSALLAAGLVADFADEHSLEFLCGRSFYLTSDHPVDSMMISEFEVVDCVKPNVKAIGKILAAMDIGTLEIKRRGVLDNIHHQLSKLKLHGRKSLTIILSETSFGFRAILCKRTKAIGNA